MQNRLKASFLINLYKVPDSAGRRVLSVMKRPQVPANDPTAPIRSYYHVNTCGKDRSGYRRRGIKASVTECKRSCSHLLFPSYPRLRSIIRHTVQVQTCLSPTPLTAAIQPPQVLSERSQSSANKTWPATTCVSIYAQPLQLCGHTTFTMPANSLGFSRTDDSRYNGVFGKLASDSHRTIEVSPFKSGFQNDQSLLRSVHLTRERIPKGTLAVIFASMKM